jgi:hypothetical protein
MKKKRAWHLAVGFLATIAVMVPGAECEIKEIHGADSSFRTDDIGICWGMLRGAPGSDVQVIMRIRSLTEGSVPYSDYAVQAVHPLTQVTEWVVTRRPLEKINDLSTPREVFRQLTGRRIFFYKPSALDPELSVFYLGIPDTTPEFIDAAQLEHYFDVTFKRLIRR